MIREYIMIFKRYPLILLTLGFAYGATIVFTFFGPILSLSTGQLAPILSIMAVVFHVLGFYIKPFRTEQNLKYLISLYIALLPLILSFYIIPIYLKVLTIMLYAYMIARIGSYWTRVANSIIPNHIRGKIISGSLFISFMILFFTNMISPILSKPISLFLPAVMSGLSVFFYKKLTAKYKVEVFISKQVAKSNIHTYFLFVFLIVVYIAGGFSYAGIYPTFEPYRHIDRYYNVFFFLIAIIIAGTVLDKFGRKVGFAIGVGLLGISFTFFIMPSSVLTYFITQTFLQAGWAFVNAFGWSFSWDMAERLKREELFPYGIAAMLMGTSIGAFSSQIIRSRGIVHSSIYGIVTFIPLFIAIVFLVLFPETLSIKKQIIDYEKFKLIDELKGLTPREIEVCYHAVNGMSNKKIGETLFITENTVKTHIKRVYSKLYVSSRNELKSYINGII